MSTFQSSYALLVPIKGRAELVRRPYIYTSNQLGRGQTEGTTLDDTKAYVLDDW